MTACAVPEPEVVLLRKVTLLAKLYGWRTYHVLDSRRSTAGFPDLVLVKPGQPVWFVELKSRRGRVRLEQHGWLTDLSKATGLRVGVWRPGEVEEIAAVLAA